MLSSRTTPTRTAPPSKYLTNRINHSSAQQCRRASLTTLQRSAKSGSHPTNQPHHPNCIANANRRNNIVFALDIQTGLVEIEPGITWKQFIGQTITEVA